MTEWLLSGHNTQETSGVMHPLTATINVDGLNEELRWTTRAFAGHRADDLDFTIDPAVTVQSRVYLNVTFFMRNVAIVMPFDPGSIGAPSGLIEPYGPIPFMRRVLMPLRLRQLYRVADRFYKEDFEAHRKALRDLYQALRRAQEPPMEVIDSFYNTDLFFRTYSMGKAHIVASMMVTMIDSIVREKRPELLGLFVGERTTTSMIAERIWQLRGVAQACGPAVVELLKEGVTDLDRYRALPEAKPFVEGVEAFLEQYGHRGFRYEVDLGTERLDDHPEHVILAVAGQLDVPLPPPERAEKARRESEEVLRKLPLTERLFWTKFLKWGRALIAWRENTKSLISMRQAVIALSARHLSRYYFPNENPDYLFYYTLDEFIDFVSSHGEKRVEPRTIARRKAEFELHSIQAPPPELIWYDVETKRWRPVEETTNGAKASEEVPTHFRGIPVSAGSGPVEGVALVTGDPIEAARRLLKIKEPVILVTRFTDPAWSSLFGKLTGVVTELGGVISHAAVVARENGLPAVVGVTDITRYVHDGQRLRIDGGTGLVELLD